MARVAHEPSTQLDPSKSYLYESKRKEKNMESVSEIIIIKLNLNFHIKGNKRPFKYQKFKNKARYLQNIVYQKYLTVFLALFWFFVSVFLECVWWNHGIHTDSGRGSQFKLAVDGYKSVLGGEKIKRTTDIDTGTDI